MARPFIDQPVYVAAGRTTTAGRTASPPPVHTTTTLRSPVQALARQANLDAGQLATHAADGEH